MSQVKNLPDIAKNWKAGGEGGKPPVRLPDAPLPYTRRELTEERKSGFLDNLAKFGTVQKAAEMTDGNPDTRRTYMRAMARDPGFGKACEDAFEAHKQRRLDVLDEEFFQGRLEPVTNSRGLVIDPETKKPIWIRKRDPKIILAVAKKYDWGLREVKTNVNIDVGNPNAADPNDPQFIVKSSDLWRLSQADMETLTRLLKLVHENRREAMAEITARPDYLDVEDVPYTDDTLNNEDNPYDI